MCGSFENCKEKKPQNIHAREMCGIVRWHTYFPRPESRWKKFVPLKVLISWTSSTFVFCLRDRWRGNASGRLKSPSLFQVRLINVPQEQCEPLHDLEMITSADFLIDRVDASQSTVDLVNVSRPKAEDMLGQIPVISSISVSSHQSRSHNSILSIKCTNGTREHSIRRHAVHICRSHRRNSQRGVVGRKRDGVVSRVLPIESVYRKVVLLCDWLHEMGDVSPDVLRLIADVDTVVYSSDSGFRHGVDFGATLDEVHCLGGLHEVLDVRAKLSGFESKRIRLLCAGPLGIVLVEKLLELLGEVGGVFRSTLKEAKVWVLLDQVGWVLNVFDLCDDFTENSNARVISGDRRVSSWSANCDNDIGVPLLTDH